MAFLEGTAGKGGAGQAWNRRAGRQPVADRGLGAFEGREGLGGRSREARRLTTNLGGAPTVCPVL